MNQLFYINDAAAIKYTYGQFIEHINSEAPDGPDNYLAIVSLIKKLVKGNKNSIEDLLVEIKNSTEIIWLATSGTTGQPKEFGHKASGFVQNVRVGKNLTGACWALAYSAKHTAGLQTIFQALFTQSTLVDVYQHSANAVFSTFRENEVTHITATPTFYRLSLPFPEPIKSVVQATLGGEVATKNVIDLVKKNLPNARIRNIYASTEFGPLLVSDSEVFVIPDRLTELVKIENEELQVHSSLIGKSSVEKDSWFHTNDRIEWVNESEGKFRFIGRNDDFVKVGGYRVNLLRVEQTVMSMPGVKAARVTSRPNSLLGTVIIAEVLQSDELDEVSIVKHLKSQLEPYEVPQRVKLVAEMEMTETGKISRK